jgi:hypothetical protein
MSGNAPILNVQSLKNFFPTDVDFIVGKQYEWFYAGMSSWYDLNDILQSRTSNARLSCAFEDE